MFKKITFKKEYIHCVPDECLIGKRVLYGDTWTDIKGQVESNNWTSRRRTLSSISYDSDYPFVIKDDNERLRQYKFIYYDTEWETEEPTKIYYCYLRKDEPEFIFDNEKPSNHVYAEFTDYFEANEWCKKYDRFALEAKAWEEGKTIQRKNVNGNWEDCEPEWDLYVDYRVKPEDKPEPIEIEKDVYVANGAEIPKKRRMTNRELAKWLAQGNGQLGYKESENNIFNISTSCVYDCMDNALVDENIVIRSWDEKEWHEPEVEVRI